MTNTLKLGDTTVSRIIATATAVATIAVMSGVAMFAGALQANANGHENLENGSLIRAEGSIDVYIFDRVGEKTYRRLILNPEVFNSYGHLRWGDVQDLPPAVVSAPTITDLVMESRDDGSIVTGDVYQVVPQNDTGTKHHLQMTPAEFEAEGYDWDAIRRVNNLEFNLYATGAAITADGEEEEEEEEGTTNTEGTMTVKRAVNPGNVDVQPGETAAVLGFSVKAEESSMNFQRVDVTLDVTSGGQSLQNTLDTISLYRGSTLLATESVSNANFTDNNQDGDEIIRLDGFSNFIGLDQEVSYEVRITAAEDDNLTTDQVIDVNVDFDAGSGGATLKAIRAVDSAGIQQFGGTTSGRTFTVEATEDASLALTTSANDPDERLVLADDDTTTEDVEVLRFVLEATDGDVLLTDLVVTTTISGEANYDNFSYLRLYDGSGTLVGEESAAATVTFADVDVDLTEDAEQDFRVDVGLRDWDGATQGATLAASVSSSDMTAEDSDGDNVDPTGGLVEGEDINIYSQAPDIEFVSASLERDPDDNTLADGHITFDVTAHGSDIYVQVENNENESASGTFADSEASTTTWTWDMGSESAASGTEADGVFLISENATVQFRVNVAMDNTAGTAGFKKAFVEQVAWDTDVEVDTGGTLWDSTDEDWALEDLETESVNLQTI